MKSRKKSRGGRVSLFVLVVAVLAVVIIAACMKLKPFSGGANKAGEAIVQIAKELSLDTEFIQLSCHGDIAEIDIVSPGLDTCSMRVALYDLKNDKLLSETTLDEGAWVTGQTDNGFYAIDQNKKTVYLYDKSGECTFEKSFSDNNIWSPVCGVSEDEKYLIYTLSNSGGVCFYELKTGDGKMLADGTSLRESLGFADGKMYAVGIQGEVFAIDAETSSVLAEVADSRLNTYSPYYSLGTTEYSFIVASKNGVEYVPFNSVDELIVGVGEEGFVTSVSNPDSETLRIYNLKDKKLGEVNIKDTVESVCYTDDGRLLIVAGDAMKKKHSLYVCDLNALDYDTLTVNDSDIPLKEEPEIDVPEAEGTEEATIIKDVPVLSQFPDFPTGCESVSTVIVLKFLGEDISASEFIDGYLPQSIEYYYDGFKRYGPSPYEYFIGNPRTSASYGCMAPVIEKALCNYFGSSDRVLNTTGIELSKLCTEYIDNDIPVLVWATINMLETNPQNSWYLEDGSRYSWPGNEHCLVLIGYDSDYYYFNDPYAGKTVKYEKETADARYSDLGKQSLVVIK